MTVDSQILPPNFSTIYRLQSVDGYDPLYLQRYGELIAASERSKPNIDPPFGFNRIITPHNFDSKIVDLLGVKYVLSLSDISSPKLTKVFQEGQTQIYENKQVLPRAFFVRNVIIVDGKTQAMKTLFDTNFTLRNSAVVEKQDKIKDEILMTFSPGTVNNFMYTENDVRLSVTQEGTGFLILTDSYYPSWHVFIDGAERKVYRVDYNFRAVIVPQGKHTIEFKDRLF